MAVELIHESRQNESAIFLIKSRKNLFPDIKQRNQDIQRKLNLWHRVLEDLDARKNKESSVHNLEREIRDLVSRLQNVLETYSNEDQRRRGRSIIRKFIDDFKSFWKVDLDVKEINEQIKITMLSLFTVLALGKTEEERSHSANENPETKIPQKLRRSISASGENDIVGKYYRLETLKSALLDDKDRVICIYGMGGIGKTTLAHKLYTDRNVQLKFNILSAVEIGQELAVRNVLENFLEQLPEGKERIKQPDQTNETLIEHFKKYAKDGRYLIVLDDIRSLDDWKFLRRIIPNNKKGSKLMLTTRSVEVAFHASEEEDEPEEEEEDEQEEKEEGEPEEEDEPDRELYVMRPLSMSDSLKLFQKAALLGDLDGETEENSFKKKKMDEVLELCSGVPSAIIAVREVLAAKHTYEWEKVLQDINLLIDRDRPVEQIVLQKPISDLIFAHLPYHLKPCFLYLGLFPEGSKIEVKHLYFLWKAEGLISRNDGQKNETTMDLAESYLSNLEQREIVEVEEEETPSLRKYKYCWVHEHMKNHCLMKGKEYFFKVLDFGRRTPREVSDSSSTSNPARRMALHLDSGSSSSTSISVDQIRNEEVDQLMCLVFLNPCDLQMKLEWPRRMFDPKKYRRLRALSFERVDFQERGLPRGTTKLISLKYLSFKGCKLGVLASSIGNLSFLEILDLQVSGPIIIPNVLRKMVKLVYLYLPLEFQTLNNDKLRLGSLKELEILENFDTTVCNVADLFEMTKLRHLSMTVRGILGDLEQIVRRLDGTSENTSVLYPSIKVKNFDCCTEERHSVFRKLLNCRILPTLHMDGHLGQIPPHYEITQSLTEMVLKGSQLKEDPMTTLDKLPELQVLLLQDNAFYGKKMICVKSSFMKLKRLELSTLNFLETWEVEEESMPVLSILKVKNCRKLQIPPQHELRNRFPPIKFENDN